jgi:hypothetical protein
MEGLLQPTPRLGPTPAQVRAEQAIAGSGGAATAGTLKLAE